VPFTSFSCNSLISAGHLARPPLTTANLLNVALFSAALKPNPISLYDKFQKDILQLGTKSSPMAFKIRVLTARVNFQKRFGTKSMFGSTPKRQKHRNVHDPAKLNASILIGSNNQFIAELLNRCSQYVTAKRNLGRPECLPFCPLFHGNHSFFKFSNSGKLNSGFRLDSLSQRFNQRLQHSVFDTSLWNKSSIFPQGTVVSFKKLQDLCSILGNNNTITTAVANLGITAFERVLIYEVKPSAKIFRKDPW
jgi:hypothetical protein